MAEETRASTREFQLETRHLAAIIVLIALLCVTSFMLGRWVERQTMRATAAGAMSQADPESVTVEDINRELTYFRTLGDGDSPPDVERPEPVVRSAPAALEPGPGDVSSVIEKSTLDGNEDGIMIQVMATKDLSSAIAMRQKLVQRGYSVVISEGSGPADSGLRKVRVGPYASRKEAERAARRLESEEGVRTWIPR
jgi:cell division septation protein DedD